MIRFELRKLMRSRRPLHAALALLAYLGLMLVGFYTYAQDNAGGRAEFRYTFENDSYFNGLTFSIYAFYFGFGLIVPVFLATESAAQFAGESRDRTLELLLTRPLSKRRIFFSKLFVTGLLASGSAAFLLIASLSVGLLLVGWGDLDLYPGVLQMTAVHQHLDQPVALMRFLWTLPFCALMLSTPLAFAIAFSVWMRNPVSAAGSALALILIMHVLSSVHLFEQLQPFLFTSYLDSWRQLFQEQVSWPVLARDLSKLLAFTCLFLALAWRRFRLREEP